MTIARCTSGCESACDCVRVWVERDRECVCSNVSIVDLRFFLFFIPPSYLGGALKDVKKVKEKQMEKLRHELRAIKTRLFSRKMKHNIKF